MLARGWLLRVALVLCVSGCLAAADTEPPLSPGEEIAIARLSAVRAVGGAFAEAGWPGFNPIDYPAIIYEPGDWAIGVGFSAAPPGFHRLEGVMDRERPIFRAAPGSFRFWGPSPAMVAGQWAVISRFDSAEVLPTGDHLGRTPADVRLGDFAADAFHLYLMKERKTESPLVSLAPGYPETAELMATSAVEQRLLLAAVRMQYNERNIEIFRGLIRQIIAVRREYWKMIGPDLAEQERQVENWDGLSCFAASMVHRMAVSRTIPDVDLGMSDPTFQQFEASALLRLMVVNYPLLFTSDNPAVTPGQVSRRGCALAFLIDRLTVDWRANAVRGDRSLIDLLGGIVELKAADEGSVLAQAKEQNHYEAALKLARADLANLHNQREKLLADLFPPGPGRVEIRLKKAHVTRYRDDPLTSGYLSASRLIHPGGLEVHLEGLDLELEGSTSGGAPRVLTEVGPRRADLKGMTVALPSPADARVGTRVYREGKKPVALSGDVPLRITADRLSIKASAGTITTGPDGTLILEIP